jgi:hypothetical protein
MSQTETILLIILGFSLASLIALFMGRMVWTVALKLGAKRMQRQMPSTLVDLQAERNRLRAEYAMMAERLGSRLEEAKLKAAEQMAEVNRHRNRLRQMESGDVAGAAELRDLRSQVKALEAALSEAALREQDLRRRLASAEPNPPKAHRRKPVAAEAPASPQPSPPHADPEIRLRQRIERLAELARPERAGTPPPEAPPQPGASSDSEIAEKLAEAERRTAELEEQLHKLDAEWTANSAAATPPEGKPQPDSDEQNVISLSARIHNLRKSLGRLS